MGEGVKSIKVDDSMDRRRCKKQRLEGRAKKISEKTTQQVENKDPKWVLEKVDSEKVKINI